MTFKSWARGRSRVLLAVLAVALVVVATAGAAVAPVATDDFVTTTAGTPVTFNAFANDIDPDGGPVQMIRIEDFEGADPLLEALFVDGFTGEITFQPRSPFTGVFSFQYVIEDDEGDIAKTHVQVSVRETDVPTVGGHGMFDDGGHRTLFELAAGPAGGTFFLQRPGGGVRFSGSVASVTGSGPNATLTGTGSFNGEPGYSFEAALVEKGSPGGFKGDRVGVEIRDPGGAVVYTTGGTTAISVGNVVVL